MIINCGYNNINLIRRPFRKMSSNQNQSSKIRIEELGDFNLIPLENDSFYNVENQVFSKNGDTGQIYTISDPDVGVLIPHIVKFGKFPLAYKTVDIDNCINIPDFNAIVMSQNSSIILNNVMYNVLDFIFTQPIFLKTNDVWYSYVPRYKINDSDIVFEKIEITDFNNMFEEDEDLEINDVVISDQNVSDMNFAQFGIGKNGLSLKNGISYTIDGCGNADFNIGNIKSDSQPFAKIKMNVNNQLTIVDKKLEVDSYRKGDVLSGTSFTSLLGTVIQNVIDEYTNQYVDCDTDGNVQTKNVNINGNSYYSSYDIDNTNNNTIYVRLKNTNTRKNPTFRLNGGDRYIRQIMYNGKFGNDLINIPEGYYKVTPVELNANTRVWKFESDKIVNSVNTFLKKTSSFDILIVKK
jgi:hypothetical protein